MQNRARVPSQSQSSRLATKREGDSNPSSEPAYILDYGNLKFQHNPKHTPFWQYALAAIKPSGLPLKTERSCRSAGYRRRPVGGNAAAC